MVSGYESHPCEGTHFDLWFGPAEREDGRPSETLRQRRFREALALSFCARCPLREACLELELERPLSHQWGVRGGMTERERRAEIRRRRKAAKEAAEQADLPAAA